MSTDHPDSSNSTSVDKPRSQDAVPATISPERIADMRDMVLVPKSAPATVPSAMVSGLPGESNAGPEETIPHIPDPPARSPRGEPMPVPDHPSITSASFDTSEALLLPDTSIGTAPLSKLEDPSTATSVQRSNALEPHPVSDPGYIDDAVAHPADATGTSRTPQTTGDEPSEDAEFPSSAAPETDSLQFESFVRQAICGRYQNLIWWCVGEILFCLGVFSYADHQRFVYVLKDYFVVLLIGGLAINGNLFFLLFISERIRNLRRFIEKVTGDDLIVSDLYQKILYLHTPLYTAAGLCIILGYFTFAELGIAASIPIAKGIKVALFVVFGTLGLVIGFVINVWRFFFKLGPLIRNIDTSNPDRMGGLQPISELNLWLLYIGAFLIAVYTFGAGYSPYEYTASKQYAYLWTVMAVSLWIIAVFVPTYTIHQVLKNAKLDQQNQLAQVKGRILIGFEQTITEAKITALGIDHIESYASSVKSAVDVLKYFEQDLELMTTWPYHNTGKTLVKLLSIQAITNVLIHWSNITQLFVK
jgi:hypothetical protein